MAKIQRAPKSRTLTPDVRETCDHGGDEILESYQTFTFQDVVDFFKRRNSCYEVAASWFPGWIRKMKRLKYVEEIPTCYDMPNFKVIRIPEKVRQVTALWDLPNRGI
jgi:hypothetical protein